MLFSTLVKSKPLNIQKLDMSLDPGKKVERENQTKAAIKRYEDSFGKIDLDKSYQPLFELLWHGQMPCNDIKGLTSQAKDELSFIKKCYWKGEPISCNSIFQKRPTDRGLCCSFNMEKAENIFKDSKYKDAISMRQVDDIQHGFDDGEKPKWYTETNEPIPEAGRKKGLTLIFDGHTDKISSGTVSDNFQGFPIIVDDNDKFPLSSVSELIARPGYESNVRVNAFHLESLNETRKYGPDKRHCYFPDEYELEMHNYYSQANCIFECELQYAENCIATCDEFGEECNCKTGKTKENGTHTCIPWFYPSNGGQHEQLCNPWNIKKFKQILEKQIPKDQCKYCLPDCTTTIYDTSISYAELRKCDRTTLGGTSLLCDLVHSAINPAPWINIAQTEYTNANQTVPYFLDTAGSTKSNEKRFSDQRSNRGVEGDNSNLIFTANLEENPAYDAFKKDIGIINVFFKDKKIMQYVTANRMSFFDFLSQIGGSLGLVMGISLISIVEIFYWLFFRLLPSLGGENLPPYQRSAYPK